MAIKTPEAFLAMLAKSRLLTAERLDEARDAMLLTNDIEQLCQILIDQGLVTGWQTSQLLTGRTSFFLGNYVLLDLLGSGGMGSVFLARHTTMNRFAALKIISKKVAKDPDSLDRFLAEARATASLDHPNIVRAYDVGIENDHFYIVMEYVPGNDLEEIANLEGPLDFQFIADCIRQAADGLAHAHGRNMIHCDIKPSNLLVTDQDTVKILDMGMARLVGKEDNNADDSSIRRDERILGTVDYMAPEQAMRGPDFDHRADIYSLGCTLYFLLTGRPPFSEGTLTQRILQHQTQEPPDIAELRPDAPEDLIAICRKMMAKNPRDRYQSVAEVSQALANWRPKPHKAEASSKEAQKPAGAASPLAATLEGEGIGVPKPDELPAWFRKRKSIFEDDRKLIRVMAVVAVAAIGLMVTLLVYLTVAFPDPDNEIIGHRKRMIADEVAKKADDKGKPGDVSLGEPKPSDEPSVAAAEGEQVPSEEPQPETVVTEPEKTPEEPSEPESAWQPPSEKEAEPFARLVDKVELPELGVIDGRRRVAGTPWLLGKLRLGTADTLALELIGGTTAVIGGKRFVLSPAEENRTWLVHFLDAEQKQSDAARIWFDNEGLLFQWTETTTDVPLDHLRNCVLRVRVNADARLIQLSKPSTEDPIGLDFVEGVKRRLIPLPYPPDPVALRLAVTSVEGKFREEPIRPNVVLQPGESTDILLTDPESFKVVLRVEYPVRGNRAEIRLATFFQLSNQRRLFPFTPVTIQGLRRRVVELQDSRQTLAAQIEAQQNRGASYVERLKNRLAADEAAAEELDKLNRFCEAAEGTSLLYFRQYIAAADGHEIELAAATPPEPKQESEPTPSP